MLVFYAVMLTMLLGFVGLAVDVGRMELRTEQLQEAADAGALSGAAEWAHLQNGTTTTVPIAAVTNAAKSDAQADVALNNYSTTGLTITSQLTAGSGAYATDYAAVQTTITQSVPTFFLKLLPGGAAAATITVKGVADAPPCAYFFSNPAASHASGGIDMSSAFMNLNCPIYVKNIVQVDGFSYVQNQQIKSSRNTSGPVTGGGSSTYPPFWNAPVLGDPLAYVTAPPYTGCDNVLRINVITPGTVLQPGRYCGLLGFPGITVTGAAVTMAPGLYVITGGVSFTNATVTGSGVTLYLTKGGAAGFGQFNSSSSNLNLSAPKDNSVSGTIPGVVIMGDRSWVGGNQDFIFSNTGTFNGDGLIYTTGTGINLDRITMSGPNYFGMVTANVSQRLGNVTFSANYATVAGGSPLHNAVSLVQ